MKSIGETGVLSIEQESELRAAVETFKEKNK